MADSGGTGWNVRANVGALSGRDVLSGLDGMVTSPVGTSLQEISGPLFLGFAFQFFGMGIVLVLSANYYTVLASRPKMPREPSRYCGFFLVTSALLFNLAQTAVDMHRGWQMFATNFMNLLALLTPNVGYFLSPFLGIIPAALTQAFLLRRCLLFISSLSSFWPRSAHPVTRWIFGGIMGCLILVSSSAGTVASVMIWKSPNLWNLEKGDRVSNPFQIAQLAWLTVSSGVDVTLSAVLCLELWWARKHLANKGGAMRQVVSQLMFVTFHGGLAVTTIQVSALFLYQFAAASSWCYFPVLSLPKIYNITLILSLSLPQGQTTGPSPSHVFSLPTIVSHQPSLTLPPRPPGSQEGMPPRAQSVKPSETEQAKQPRRATNPCCVSSTVKRGWRVSQDWIRWSLVGHPSQSLRGSSSGQWDPNMVRRKGMTAHDEVEVGAGGLREEDEKGEVEDAGSIKMEYRRPSQPNSLAPLLGTSSFLTLTTCGSSFTPAPQLATGVSHIRNDRIADPRSPQQATRTAPPDLAAPMPSVTLHHAHSFSVRDDRRLSLPTNTLDGQCDRDFLRARTGPENSWQDRRGGGLLNTPDPFAALSPRHPRMSPLCDLRPPHSDPKPRGPVDERGDEDEDEEEAEADGARRHTRAGARMLRFEEMLAGGPDEADSGRRHC